MGFRLSFSKSFNLNSDAESYPSFCILGLHFSVLVADCAVESSSDIQNRTFNSLLYYQQVAQESRALCCLRIRSPGHAGSLPGMRSCLCESTSMNLFHHRDRREHRDEMQFRI